MMFWKTGCNCFQIIEFSLTRTLSKTISVLDPKGPQKEKEKFYHALLSGILVGNGTWGILSNRESGDGFADLIVETDNPDSGIIIELKSVGSLSELDRACERAMSQIHDRRYDQYLRNEGRNDIWAYGIAFFKKRCKVVAEKLNDARLLAVASERMAHFNPSSLISEEEMNRRLGITEDELADF